VKLALAHLYRDEHARAEEALREARELVEIDAWGRFTWYPSLFRALAEVALSEGRLDDALDFATRSVELAICYGVRKHLARGLRLQGEVLAAHGRLADSVRAVEASLALAETLGTAREVWLGRAALGRVLSRLGRDADAEASFAGAVQVIETIAGKLTTPVLRRSFLTARPVLDVYAALGRRAPVL
jgi:tetratricopeptide (TPR) repeat protein